MFLANIKIKIITNDGPLSSLPSKSKTDFLTDETATQFKDMLVNMLVCIIFLSSQITFGDGF